ncbi:MAG: DUF177 domain-containing protein [Lachnospiraceae bacterium]|nr:DUF177 domain-containing protein [Lachnospiraceae bacterium]MCI9545931.1 DUF177 domain-containing protein [Lachnospiraceae bacterium]
MRIQLTEILSADGQALHREVPLERDTMEVGAERFRLFEKSPVTLDIVHTGDRVIEIEGSCEASAKIPCGRCLEEVDISFALHISRKVDLKESDEERVRELDEGNFITGTELDVEQLVYNELLVQWPMRVLCREDCKGLCSRCGANLNNKPCDCDRTSLDPRMAAICDIFSEYKEV